MEKTKKNECQLYKRLPLILALVLTALDIVLAVCTQEMVYLTNDDGSIQATLSGAWTGTPIWFSQLIGAVVSVPIAGLYRLFPAVQWWYVCSQIVQTFGIFLIHLCLLKLAQKSKFSIPFVVGVLLYFDIGLFVFPIANISFTFVPTILGAGLVAVLFWLAEAETIPYKKWIFAGIAIGYIVLFSWRPDTGRGVLTFLLLAFLYYFVSRENGWKKIVLKFAVTAVIFLLLAGSMTVVNRAVMRQVNGEEFVAFNWERIDFMDYPHVTYDEAPEFFEEIGWDRDTYYLIYHYCYLNEHTTTEAFSYITDNAEVTTTDVRELCRTIYHDKACRGLAACFAISFVMALFVTLVYHKKKTVWFFLLNNLGAAALVCYQLLSGRAMHRSLFVVVVPALIINLILCLREEMEKKALRYVFEGLTIVLCAACVVPMWKGTFQISANKGRANQQEWMVTTCAYAGEHEENLYITQAGDGHIGNYQGPRKDAAGATNLMKWGGWYSFSAVYYEQLAANGLTELTGDTFRMDNVYFVASADVTAEEFVDDGHQYFPMLLRYLEKDCGAVGFVPVDTIQEKAYVYHFVFEDTADQYATYYDIADGIVVQMD